MQLHTVPRVVVRTWLRAARLPLQAAEAISRPGQHEAEWPPTLAFEAFEAQVKQTVGAVLRDDQLVDEGRLAETKVARLREAAQLETTAQRREAAATAKHEAQQEATQQRRRRVERDAREREQRLERERISKEQEVDRTAARKKAQVARAESAARKSVERQQRTAERARIKAEREALHKERAAVAAKGRTVAVDKKIQATRAQRRKSART
jgi:colicin import membrane protein